MSRHVRFAARDTGAAHVLAAFIRQWPAREEFTYDVWSMGLATGVFRREGFFPRVFQAPGAVLTAWDARPPDALVTVTSHRYAQQFDRLLWSLARNYAVPSLALLDSYMNLEQRFGDEADHAPRHDPAPAEGELRPT